MVNGTNPQNIPLDVFANCGLINLSPGKEAGYGAHCVTSNYSCTFISRQMHRLFSVVTYALGSMRARCFFKSCMMWNTNKPRKVTPQPSTPPLTNSPENTFRIQNGITPDTIIYPGESDDLSDNPVPPEIFDSLPIPGTTGRWCPVCKAYWCFAVLKRYGHYSGEVDYLPLCPKHKCVLWPDKVFLDDNSPAI